MSSRTPPHAFAGRLLATARDLRAGRVAPAVAASSIEGIATELAAVRRRIRRRAIPKFTWRGSRVRTRAEFAAAFRAAVAGLGLTRRQVFERLDIGRDAWRAWRAAECWPARPRHRRALRKFLADAEAALRQPRPASSAPITPEVSHA